MLFYELKTGSEKARWGNTCSFIKQNYLDCRLNTCILILSQVRPCHNNIFRVYQVVFPMLDAPGSNYLFFYLFTFPPSYTEGEHDIFEGIH